MIDTRISVVKDYKVNLSSKDNVEVNQRILKFGIAMANKGQSASYYATHRNTTENKASDDILVGKKAEVAAMCVLRDHYGYPGVGIDLEIRHGRNKGWQEDLIYPFVKVHVKGCSINTLRIVGEYSWTFQKSDHIFKSPTADEDLLVLVYMDDWADASSLVRAILPWEDARKKLRPPKLAKHAEGKTCLYYKDFT